MNNYRTNCSNRRVMPGCSQSMQNMQNYPTQRMETMQSNCYSRTCTDMPSNRETDCERSSNGTQNCQMNHCGCNDVQNNQNNSNCNDIQNGQTCNCSCNETQSNQNNNCECKEPSCEQSCNCSCNCNNSQNNQNNHCGNNNVQNGQDNNCNCNMSESSACRPEPTLCEFPIGMAYVPIQQWRRLYDICAAFRNGTLFQELNLDFLGRRCN